MSAAEIADDPDQAAAWLPSGAGSGPGGRGVDARTRRALPGGRVDALVAIERQLAWLAAMQTRLLAVMAAADDSDDRWVREDVACALRLSGLTRSAA